MEEWKAPDKKLSPRLLEKRLPNQDHFPQSWSQLRRQLKEEDRNPISSMIVGMDRKSYWRKEE